MRTSRFRFIQRLGLLALGATTILSGCDPLLRGTSENGIINLSTSFLTSFLQAIIQVFQETSSA